MKTITLFFTVCFITVLAGIFSCTKDEEPIESNSNLVVTTPLQVQAMISRSARDDGYTELSYDISIYYNGIPVNNATVMVNETNVPRVGGFIDGWYNLREYSNPIPNYVPGQNYTVTVEYDGKTYTETEKAPGGITANADFTKIEWANSSKYATLDVRHLYGSTTHSVPNAKPGPLSSPQTIPLTAYPSSGTYIVAVWLQNITKKSFGTLSGDNCHLNIIDYKAWRITK